jgi:DUF1680 family protein
MILFLACISVSVGSAPADYPVKPVPFTAVRLTDKFWAPRIEINRTVTIPFAFQKCEETGRVALFERAALAQKGQLTDKRPPGYPFDDTDVYKVLEGASYALSVHPDPKLDAYVDGLIAKIAAAQEPDGYLYTTRTINPESPHAWSGKKRWEMEERDSHELYNLGHLFEAAAAHYQATGKRSLLNVALKAADLLVRTFGPGKQKIWPGHQITEMGLVKLYRITQKPEYLQLAKFLLDSRGGSGEYWQAHKPVVQQDSAVGHAVRASYMYSGMADVAALLQEPDYLHAIDRIWADVVGTKLYITGGIGATGAGEAFGRPYELPNMSAYCETCAAVGNDYWNFRLFLLHKDAKYIDVLERTLYNGLISGVSLDGKSFFYPNPLESAGQHGRSPWFGVACCPGNITRFMASVPGYFYAQDGKSIFVNLYAAGSANVQLDNGPKVKLTQQTDYPWAGKIQLRVDLAKPSKFAVRMRIPGWSENRPVPSDLYRFKDSAGPAVKLTLNGKLVVARRELGYAVIDRTWKTGDSITLDLPMQPRRIVANSKIAADLGRVAIQRGPILYCAEWPDNPGGVRSALLPDDARFATLYQPQKLNGIVLIQAPALAISRTEDGGLSEKNQVLTLIPYYAWANRGRGEMAVWIANQKDAVKPKPWPSIASKAKITASGGTGIRAINDQILPSSARDFDTTFFHWWPKKGTTEWVELNFDKETKVSEASVFWFDDTGRGECRTPESWQLLYRKDGAWIPVQSTDVFGTQRDKSNRVTFNPVATDALRLEIKLKQGWSTGIYEWEVK